MNPHLNRAGRQHPVDFAARQAAQADPRRHAHARRRLRPARAVWRALRVLSVLLLMPLSGCFVFWIPPQLINGIADRITGVPGNHCVASSAGVGDTVVFADGSTAKVVALRGPGLARCTDPALPVRALLKLAPKDAS